MEEKETALTFDDVTLVPAFSKVLPKDVSLRTMFSKRISLNIPLVSAAMDTVTESATAIALAQQGGIGTIHRSVPVERQVREVAKVKGFEFYVISHPATVHPDDQVSRVLELQKNRGFNSFPVVDKNKRLTGLITHRDLLFEDGSGKKVKDIMTKELVTVEKIVEEETAKEIMHKNRIEKLPVVDRQGRLVALITLKDILNKERFPNANKDKKGRLMVAAAVGPKDLERAKTLVEAEADAIVIDTAHGHSKNVVEAVKIFKKAFDCELIAGNISTAEAAKALIKAGADAVKVGQGAGAICTTRVIAGIGVPQFSAVLAVAKAAEKQAVPVIADGGIKYSGDITKAIAAGASSVMIGSLFAGCEETPGKTVFMYNRKFKQYRGMGSVGAMASGQSQDRYLQEHLKRTGKFVPEGIEGIVPFRGKLEEIVYQLLGGLRSGMGYTGAKTIEELRTKTKWVKVTSAGLRESHPHDVIITEEAPNYQRTAHI